MLDEKIIFKQQLFTWLNVDKLNIEMAFLGDNLSIFMSMFVTFVGWLIHIYAVGYMNKDKGLGKFFAYFNLFLVTFARYHFNMDAQIITVMVISIAAAEAAIFLSVIILLYRSRKSLDTNIFTTLTQGEKS